MRNYEVSTKFTLTFIMPAQASAVSGEQAAEMALDSVVRLVEEAAESVGGSAEGLEVVRQFVERIG